LINDHELDGQVESDQDEARERAMRPRSFSGAGFFRNALLSAGILAIGAGSQAQWTPQGRAQGTASSITVFKWDATARYLVIGSPGAGVIAFDGTTFKTLPNPGLIDPRIIGMAHVAGSNPPDFFIATKSGVYHLPTLDPAQPSVNWQDFTTTNPTSGSLPVLARDTTDIAVLTAAGQTWVYVSSMTQGVYRRQYDTIAKTGIGTWQPFNTGFRGLSTPRVHVTEIEAQGGRLVAVTARDGVVDTTTAGIYSYDPQDSSNPNNWVDRTPSDSSITKSFTSVSLAVDGTSLSGLVATDDGRIFAANVPLTPSGSNWTAWTPVWCHPGLSGEKFTTVHHVVLGSGATRDFRAAVGSINGLYLLGDPAQYPSCAACPPTCPPSPYTKFQDFRGGVAVVRQGVATNGAEDELFVGASSKGFFHGPPKSVTGVFPRYDQTFPDGNIRSVAYSPGFNGKCLFATDGDSSVFAVSATGGIYKAVDDYKTANAAPCDGTGTSYFTRMNYFSTSDNANVESLGLTPNYVETGTVGEGNSNPKQNTVLVGTYGAGVFASDDSGITWVERNGPRLTINDSLPDFAEVTALAVSPKWNGGTTPNPDQIVFAAVRNSISRLRTTDPNQVVYLSTDTGLNWKPMTGVKDLNVCPATIPVWQSGTQFANGAQVHPSPAKRDGFTYVRVNSSCGSPPCRTGPVEPNWPANIGATVTDFGIIWSCQSSTPVPAEVTAIALPRTFDQSLPSSQAIYLTTDAGVFKGTALNLVTGAVSWKRLDIDGADACSDPSSVSTLVISPSFDETAAIPGTNTQLWVGTNGYGIFRSTDKGTSWQPTSVGLPAPPNCLIQALGIAPQYPASKVMYASVTELNGTPGDDPEKVYYTTDAGAAAPSWAPRFVPNPVGGPPTPPRPRVTTLAVSPCMESISPCVTKIEEVLAGTSSSNVLKEDHVTGNWTYLSSFHTVPPNIQAVAVHPDDPNVILLGTRDSGVFLGTDGGKTFRPFGKHLVSRDDRMIHEIHSVIFTNAKGNLDEYRALAGGALDQGLYYSTIGYSNPTNDWFRAELLSGSTCSGSVVPLLCGTIKDLKYVGDAISQELRATVIPSPSGACSSLAGVRALRSSRSLPDATGVGFNDFGVKWCSDHNVADVLPAAGLVANSIVSSSGGFASKGTDSGDHPTILPIATVIWGASGGSVSQLADKGGEGGSPSQVTSCDYSVFQKVGAAAWTLAGDGDAIHDLPCGSSSNAYQAVLGLSSTEALAGSVSDMYITRDRGTTWWTVNQGLPSNPDVRTLIEDTSSNIVVGLGNANSGGVYLSDSGGFSWVNISTGLTSGQLGTQGLTSAISSGSTIYYAATSASGLQAFTSPAYTGSPKAYFTAFAPDPTNPSKSCSNTVASDTFCSGAGTSVSFCDRSAGKSGTTTYLWTFHDDSSTSTSTNPTHTFLTEGTYQVDLQVTTSNGVGSYSSNVTVGPAVDATYDSFTWNSGTNQFAITWTPDLEQDGYEIWADDDPQGGGDAVRQVNCPACPGVGSSSFTSTFSSSSDVYVVLKVKSTRVQCNSTTGAW